MNIYLRNFERYLLVPRTKMNLLDDIGGKRFLFRVIISSGMNHPLDKGEIRFLVWDALCFQ